MAATDASGSDAVALTAFIPRSSLTTTPPNPSVPLSSSWTMTGEKDAGRRSSIAGSSTCAVMIVATPASIARAERHELDRVEPAAVVLHDGQRLVRIDDRVAVAREVLAAGRHARPPAAHR